MISVHIDNANRCNGNQALFVSFPYENKIVDTIRTFSTRYWDKNKKVWELPVNTLGKLTEMLPDYEFEITGNYITGEKPKIEIPKEFSFKTKPFKHQIEGFNYGLVNDKWLLGDEQGLGKTKQSIDIAIAKRLQKGYKHCLIICGVNSLKWNWVKEVRTHSDEDAYILGQRYTKNGKIKIGSNNDKLNDIINIDKIKEYFIITNVETLRQENINNALIKLCKKGTIGMIITDECHKMKNPTSQQGKAFLKLGADTMIAMTGTPLMNNPLDLYIILKWLGYEKHTFYAFKQHYCVMGGFGGYEITGYKNLNELQSQLTDIMLRRRKEDVLDLPEKTFINEYVDMTPKQAQIYNEVTSEIKMNIDQIKMASNPLAELIRMRQATGFTGILSSTVKESAKLDRMEELVEEAVNNSKKVVIFSNWTQITHIIEQRLSKRFSGASITGETKDSERQNIVDRFQAGEYDYIVGTIGAMGTGLTLTAGTVEIFLDEPWTMAAKMQAVDRCHRIGATSNVTIYTLLCKDTIDERINELVERKGAMSDALIDGKIVGNKTEILDFLLS